MILLPVPTLPEKKIEVDGHGVSLPKTLLAAHTSPPSMTVIARASCRISAGPETKHRAPYAPRHSPLWCLEDDQHVQRGANELPVASDGFALSSLPAGKLHRAF